MRGHVEHLSMTANQRPSLWMGNKRKQTQPSVGKLHHLRELLIWAHYIAINRINLYKKRLGVYHKLYCFNKEQASLYIL